jgi:hypothetical protein
MNASEPLIKCRNQHDDVKTGAWTDFRDKYGGRRAYWPYGIRHRGGMISVQAFVGNVGTCFLMIREKHED